MNVKNTFISQLFKRHVLTGVYIARYAVYVLLVVCTCYNCCFESQKIKRKCSNVTFFNVLDRWPNPTSSHPTPQPSTQVVLLLFHSIPFQGGSSVAGLFFLCVGVFLCSVCFVIVSYSSPLLLCLGKAVLCDFGISMDFMETTKS